MDTTIRRVAERVPATAGDDCVRVGIDGVDGAGKTTFADALADELTARGRHVVRVSGDDFHRVRSHRYRRGRGSPVGFFLDSFDTDALVREVLVPLGPGGDRRYRPAVHDLATDRVLDPPRRTADPGSVLVLDGLFLHRDELVAHWDLSVYLDVPFEVSVPRMARRDGTSPDPADPGVRRYVEGQRIYLARCRPAERASMVVDNR